MIIGVSLLSYTLINHLLELKDMKECAQTPGCMYCLPKWVGGTAYLLYFVSIVVLAISITCFIKAKTKKL